LVLYAGDDWYPDGALSTEAGKRKWQK